MSRVNMMEEHNKVWNIYLRKVKKFIVMNT